MTNGKTNRTPKGLEDRELDRAQGGVELENTLISSFKPGPERTTGFTPPLGSNKGS